MKQTTRQRLAARVLGDLPSADRTECIERPARTGYESQHPIRPYQPSIDWTSRASHASVVSKTSSDGRRASDSSTSNSGSNETVRGDSFVAIAAYQEARATRASSGRVLAEGRLTDITIRATRSRTGQVVIATDARCQGKALRSSVTGWRGRHAETARGLVSELLDTTREILCRVAGVGAGAPRSAVHASVGSSYNTHESLFERRQDQRIRNGMQDMTLSADPRLSNWCQRQFEDDSDDLDDWEEDTNEEDLAPAVLIVDIAWGNLLRGPADSLYDPDIDGDIHLQGACTFDDQGSDWWQSASVGELIVELMGKSKSVYPHSSGWILSSHSSRDVGQPTVAEDPYAQRESTAPTELSSDSLTDHTAQTTTVDSPSFVLCLSCRYALVRTRDTPLT